MAKEPDSLVLRLLREIRATQQDHGKKLDHLDKKVEDLYKISTHTLGVAANAHVRYEQLEARVDKLTDRVKRLEKQT
jgi:polyhydroxyalkanoate synthesis regulator phasin